MRTGYSILLGEHIDAGALEHKDCEPFQIVCPACYEPLFKVLRSELAKQIEYLSHYRQSGSYESECELRAASNSASDIEKHNSQSRNQKLTYFLKVFTSALSRDPYLGYKKSLEHSHKQINKASALSFLKRLHFDTAKQSGGLYSADEFSRFAEDYVNESGGFGNTPRTGFSLTTQIRIASDVMNLLLTEHGRKNYEALFNHAAMYLVKRCTNPAPDASIKDIEVTENIAFYITGLIQSGKNRGMELLAEMANTPIYPPHVQAPATYMLKVSAEIAHEMVGALIRLPYFDLLRENQSKK